MEPKGKPPLVPQSRHAHIEPLRSHAFRLGRWNIDTDLASQLALLFAAGRSSFSVFTKGKNSWHVNWCSACLPNQIRTTVEKEITKDKEAKQQREKMGFGPKLAAAQHSSSSILAKQERHQSARYLTSCSSIVDRCNHSPCVPARHLPPGSSPQGSTTLSPSPVAFWGVQWSHISELPAVAQSVLFSMWQNLKADTLGSLIEEFAHKGSPKSPKQEHDNGTRYQTIQISGPRHKCASQNGAKADPLVCSRTWFA